MLLWQKGTKVVRRKIYVWQESLILKAEIRQMLKCLNRKENIPLFITAAAAARHRNTFSRFLVKKCRAAEINVPREYKSWNLS